MKLVPILFTLLLTVPLTGCVGEYSRAVSYGTIVNVDDNEGAMFAQTATIWVLHDRELTSEPFNISNDANKAHLLELANKYLESGQRVKVSYHNYWLLSCIDPDTACDEVLNIEPAPKIG